MPTITIDNGVAAVAGGAVTTLALGVNGLTGGTLDDDDIYCAGEKIR